MKIKLSNVGLILFFALSSQCTKAGECHLTVTRLACPGQEEVAYKPYEGKPIATENKTTDSAEECKALMEKSSKILRKGVVTTKTVSAKFNGEAVGKASDQAECK